MTQQEVITMLEALVALGRRLETGLRRNAAAAGAAQLRHVLLRRADERAAMADALQHERDRLAGGASPDGATALVGVVPRAPLPVSDDELLVDCERADGRAVDAWRDALDRSPPTRLGLLLQEQHCLLLRSHRRTQVLLHLARHGNVLLPLKKGGAGMSRPPAAFADGMPVRHD